jgi:hypothetical protein
MNSVTLEQTLSLGYHIRSNNRKKLISSVYRQNKNKEKINTHTHTYIHTHKHTQLILFGCDCTQYIVRPNTTPKDRCPNKLPPNGRKGLDSLWLNSSPRWGIVGIQGVGLDSVSLCRRFTNHNCLMLLDSVESVISQFTRKKLCISVLRKTEGTMIIRATRHIFIQSLELGRAAAPFGGWGGGGSMRGGDRTWLPFVT